MPYSGAKDGRHYWLTPPVLMFDLQMEFDFDYDPCPFPKPERYDGLTSEWGTSNYCNPPFGVVESNGKLVGGTAWAKKAIAEHKKGKRVVFVYPVDKWILLMVNAGAQIRDLGDVRWCATEDGKPGKGIGRGIGMFVLEPKNET